MSPQEQKPSRKEDTPPAHTHAGRWTLAAVAIVGLAVPLILAVALAATADTTLRVGDAGTFNSSATSAGGYLSPAATTVQSSTGSIVVSGPLSAVRGQRLVVVDRLKSGLHLCVAVANAAGNRRVCAGVSGQWTGNMHPVEHPPQAFGWLAVHVGAEGLAYWLFWGLVSLAVAGLIVKSCTEIEAERPE